jgi:hypothetical protein
MEVDIAFANEDVGDGTISPGRRSRTWSGLLDVDGEDGSDPVNVTLSNHNTQVGWQLKFAATRDQVRVPSLDLMLPPDGTPMRSGSPVSWGSRVAPTGTPSSGWQGQVRRRR